MDTLTPEIRRISLHYLYRICGHQALFPRSLTIPLCYDPKKYPSCSGGHADVWKGRYCDIEAAAKVLRLRTTDLNDLGQIRRVCVDGVVYSSYTQNSLRLIEVLRRSRRVEGSPPSKCAAALGCDNDCLSVCDGVRMDGKR